MLVEAIEVEESSTRSFTEAVRLIDRSCLHIERPTKQRLNNSLRVGYKVRSDHLMFVGSRVQI